QAIFGCILPGISDNLGNMAGRSCTVCSHPQMAAIDLALTSGGRLVPTAAKFGVSKSALGRHRSSCLAGRLAAAAKSAAAVGEPPTARQTTPDEGLATLAEIGTAAGLTRRLVKTLDRLEQAATLAYDRQQFSGL